MSNRKFEVVSVPSFSPFRISYQSIYISGIPKSFRYESENSVSIVEEKFSLFIICELFTLGIDNLTRTKETLSLN